MVSREITDQVKSKLFAEWLPDKPGGLEGLINMATDAALEVVGQLEAGGVTDDALPASGIAIGVAAEKIVPGQLVAYNGEGQLVAATGPGPSVEPSDSDDAGQSPDPSDFSTSDFDAMHEGLDHWHQHGPNAPDHEHQLGGHGSPPAAPAVDQTADYLCPQCSIKHKRDSVVGRRHAHLFYGGQPEIVHNATCPMATDGTLCTCGAAPKTGQQRAQDRRDPHA